jgi:tRNA pseudouridine38-40 synthase
MTLEDFEKILNREKELKEKWPAHPNGLFLSKVEYPFLDLKDSHQLSSMLTRGLE